ncbi:hypothetical protein EGH21_07095 [Halomicroarcula sp. F13]|uniref:Peptidase M23 domain-containing protein n=1 Tax=Haloarcula rubra TaxID=2487747 RepID=A0AAW4PQ58_9EURY|nr:hypothetical protein [Halomicroarcula rubra]MBX0322794.1 hypothetical protein [Halomicroarcula rubra]
MAVTVAADVLHRYYRFSLYNSPFDAHDEGCAIDLYPEGARAPSPVAGEVLDTKAVRAPPKPYAAEHDHLILVDTGDYVARLLHVDPSVEAGDSVAVGDDVGEHVRAGFFAPWVPNHVHLGFRDHDADPYRASGSLPVDVAVDVEPLAWDGTGTVVETGETWARLDSPAHPAPGERFAGVANDADGVLDGGLPHYEWGGLLGAGVGDGPRRASVAGQQVGTAEGRTVAWDDVTVRANGDPVTGLALFCSRDDAGVKLVGEGVDLAMGDAVEVTVDPA